MMMMMMMMMMMINSNRDRGGSGARYDKGAHRGGDKGNQRDKRGRSPDADEEGRGRGGSRRGRGSPPTVGGEGVGEEEDGGDEEESEGEVVEVRFRSCSRLGCRHYTPAPDLVRDWPQATPTPPE